jgi:hypothetical protein
MELKIYALNGFLYIIKMGRVKQNYEHLYMMFICPPKKSARLNLKIIRAICLLKKTAEEVLWRDSYRRKTYLLTHRLN